MNDFQVINEVINTAVQQSSYMSVLISSCVFIVYTVTIKVIDYYKAKDKSKPLLEMATALKDVSSNVIKLNTVLDKVFKDAEKKEEYRCKTTIILAFSRFTDKISRECVDMIINNHIETNKDMIQENVSKLVSTEYYYIHSALANYEINGVNVANKLDKSWIDETVKAILTIMFNGQDVVSRIAQVNNKINTYANTYAIYVENKVFT